MPSNYKVITLCGSTRFKDEFMEAQKRLTLEGNIVISVGLFGHSGDNEVWSEGVKEMLDDMHKRKIDMADEIFVINVGGYVGSSTKSEIEYATRMGKTVRYLEPVDRLKEQTLSRYIEQFTSLNTAKRMGKSAPHKAVMLISVMEMFRRGMISSGEIQFTESLQRMFKLVWSKYVGESILFKPVPATPFWHLNSEPFWSLKRGDGGNIYSVKDTPSGGVLERMNVRATLDKDLVELIKDESACERLIGVLIDTYLSAPKVDIKKVLPVFLGLIATSFVSNSIIERIC